MKRQLDEETTARLRRIAANVLWRRLQMCESHVSLARMCNVSAGTIWVLESATRPVLPETLARVAAGLGLPSPESLFDEPPAEPPLAGGMFRRRFTERLRSIEAEAEAAARRNPAAADEMYRVLSRKLRLAVRTCREI